MALRHHALLLFALTSQAEPPETMVILYNSEQRRSAPLLECPTCVFVDVARGEVPPATDVLYIDGHSIGPVHVLGRSLPEFRALVRASNPRLIVANTCLFAELHVLIAVFADAPRLTSVVAAATRSRGNDALGWSSACADRRAPDAACFTRGADVFEYSRGYVAAAGEGVVRLYHRARRCEARPPVLDFGFLRYLRYDSPAGPPLLLQYDYVEIPRSCRAG